MLPALKFPNVLTSPEGLRRMVWTIPTSFVPYLTKVMWEEATLVITSKSGEKDESIVTINYTSSKINFVIFATEIFSKHYAQCRIAETMLAKSASYIQLG